MKMSRSLLLAVPVLALFLAGCPAKPKNGECKTSEDCSAQEGYGKVCVEGRCQECGADTDCKAGFVCRAMKCMPRPECERNDDCPVGKACEAGKCMTVAAPVTAPECVNDASCGSGMACQSGKCVSATPAACPVGGGKLLPVFFGFDQAVLSKEAQADLAKNATCIKEKGFTKIVVEGNTDDRGTQEYNLQLGQRRAEAAKKFLVNLGVPAKAVKTVSFGKERPVCTEQVESCWQKNRRSDVVAQ
ncbi:MAG TPA: OmpA family protein [Anaeromyxobacteraceae bacterium]|nr:OmpA family protein [Anaeromyxobacteraceae bacterium]